MDDRVETALTTFAAGARREGIPWQLGGSGLLHALGLVERVRDLDLVFPPESMEALSALISIHTGTAPDLAARQEDGFVSGFRARHPWHGVELDITSGIALDYGDRVVRLPFEPGGEWTLRGEPIPLAPIGHWMLIYRFHNPDRAPLLEPIVSEEEWSGLKERLGLPAGFTGFRV